MLPDGGGNVDHNPLTAIAVHLRAKGHDVRWYTGPSYAPRLAKLGVPHFPFVTATDVNELARYDALAIIERAVVGSSPAPSLSGGAETGAMRAS